MFTRKQAVLKHNATKEQLQQDIKPNHIAHGRGKHTAKFTETLKTGPLKEKK